MQLPTRIKGLRRQIMDNTVYDKTFEEGNFRGSSTIIIKEGKVSWFVYKRLFQCSNLRSRKSFSGKTFAVSENPENRERVFEYSTRPFYGRIRSD